MGDYIYLIALVVIAGTVIAVGVMMRASHKKEKEGQFQSALRARKLAAKRAELSKSMKIIPWTDKLIIDEGVIDKDHKLLFELINKFNENVPRFETVEQMFPLLRSLIKYTQTHFQREEKLQQISEYPYLEDHKKEHRALVEKFSGLIEKAKQAKEDDFIDVAAEMGSFFLEWLIQHVMVNDLQLKPYVERMREQAETMSDLDNNSEQPSP
tara:strand:- start:136 stop:768 length:633 start_codon:yes stop_codon:yes gene_type:complete